MAMAAGDTDSDCDLASISIEVDLKSSPNVSMDRSQEDLSQDLDSFDEDTPGTTMETSTWASSAASQHDDINGESDNDLEEPVEIDENAMPSVIEEISPVDGPCVQCEIEQPCSFRFTNNGETLYVCNEPCIKAYQAEYPGKYTVTRKKYIIEEITPKTSQCSECEQNKTCYFSHNFDGEETYYCSLNCLEGMMADEKDKYSFNLNSGTLSIDQIRPKEGQCLICEKVKPCEFSLVRYGEPCLLCERACIKILSGRERGRYYIKKLGVSKPAVSNDNNLNEGYKIQAKAAAMAQREQSFHRRCSQCTLILMIDENVLTWEAMDFCDEICLERFQNGIGSTCARCNLPVHHTSLGKYCVRFGYDIQQFCNSSCLATFKKRLKICCFCQMDFSDSKIVFRVPSDAKGKFKDFCSSSCVDKFDQMRKNPVPQPVWAKCAVCSLEKATTIEVEVTETASQRICSDPCFAAYKFANNILPDECKWCKKYFKRKPTKSFTTYDNTNPYCFCSLSCMTIYIHHTRALVSCNWCKSMKYNFDMIRRVDNGHAVTMCSLNCLNLHQESANAPSSSNGDPPPTLTPPVPSIEQGRADETTLSAEQLVTLTKTRKRRETTQSSEREDEEDQINKPKKPSMVIPDSPPSGQKKGTPTSRFDNELRVLSRQKRLTKAELNTRKRAKELYYQCLPGTEVKRSKMGLEQEQSMLEPGTPSTVPPDEPRALREPHGRITQWQRRTAKAVESDEVQQAQPPQPPSHPNTSKAEVTSVVPIFDDALYNIFTTQPSTSMESSLNSDPFDRQLDPSWVDAVIMHGGSDIDENDNEDNDDENDNDAVSSAMVSAMHAEDETAFINNLDAEETETLDNLDVVNDNALSSMVSSIFEWDKDPQKFKGTREIFTKKGGPTFLTSELLSPLDCFLKMLEPDFIDVIVVQTNKYARDTIQCLESAKKLSAKSRLKEWRPTTRWEMYKFIALLLCQGLYPNPVETGYWLGLGRMDIFRCMSYNRFLLLKKFLHFADSSNLKVHQTQAQKKLYKIKPVTDYFNGQFAKLFYPFQDVSIDESLLKWKGQLSFAQKIKTKAARIGIKTYELCDSKTGYLWKFFVYAGACDHDQDEGPISLTNTGSNLRPRNATAKIVIELAEKLFHNGHTIIMDNFYNSPLLARYLKSMGVDCYGTLRTNRQFVPESIKSLNKTMMHPGHVVSSNTEDVSIQVWRDNNIVAMISTYHKPTIGHAIKYGKTKFKPAVVFDYNKSMGGVDRKDQLLSAFPMERSRNLNWYKKVFRRLLNVAVLNCYIIYQAKVPQISHRTYREQLVLELLHMCEQQEKIASPLREHLNVVPYKRGHRALMRPILNHRHFPINTEKKYSRCVWCKNKKGNAPRSTYKCKECDVQLCLKRCFEQFHTAPDN